MRSPHAALCVVLLTSCAASSPSGPRQVSASELCADLEGLRGQELSLSGPIDTSSIVLFRSDAGMCRPGACCGGATYFYGFTCDGFGVVLFPASLEVSPEVFVDRSLETLLGCFGDTDGSVNGGTCRPTDCASRQPQPNITNMMAFRGTLAAEPLAPGATGFPDTSLPPLLLFRVAQVEWAPFEVLPIDAGQP